MPKEADRTLPNGLRIRRVPIDGTRAITALVGFDAGARAEKADENGIAHFLEHLVFKGGQTYPTTREINAMGESIGARVGAWTSHDMVVFRIRSRAEVAPQAIDLLTDFVGRPRLDPEEIDRERGVVVQEIARAADRPQDRADELIESAAFGEHPLGRPVLGTEERLRAFQPEEVVRFRERNWSGERGVVAIVGNLDAVPADDELDEFLDRFPAISPPPPHEAVPPPAATVLVDETDSRQSHLRLLYRSPVDPRDRSSRAALAVYRTLLGGSPGSLLFEEIRERRGLAYAVSAQEHAFADGAWVQVAAGVDAERCAEANSRIREVVSGLARGDLDREHVERARSYAAGRRVLAFENTNVVADDVAETVILFDEEGDPEAEIAALDAVTYEDVAAVARGLVPEPALACVGPHSAADFG
jgi:predicted Zn-dependent peptidase